MCMMGGIRASYKGGGHPAVRSGAMLVSSSEGVLLPPGCEITLLMMGVVPLTAQETVTVEAGE